LQTLDAETVLSDGFLLSELGGVQALIGISDLPELLFDELGLVLLQLELIGKQLDLLAALLVLGLDLPPVLYGLIVLVPLLLQGLIILVTLRPIGIRKDILPNTLSFLLDLL
jgi:hypothetical protein